MTNPPWAALAADAIHRLQHLRAEAAAAPNAGSGTDPLDWLDDPRAGRGMSLARTLAALPSAMPLPLDEQREIAMAGGDPWAVARENGAAHTRTRLPIDRLLLVLRLCRTTGAACCQRP